MTKKKKVVVISIVLLLMVGVVCVTYLRRGQDKQIVQRPIDTSIIPTPLIINPPQIQEPNVSTTILKEDYNLPKTLMSYKIIENSVKVSEANEMARNLGFASEINILNDELNGATYIFSDPDKYMRIVAKNGVVDFKNNMTPTKSNEKSVDNLSKDAIEYLITSGLIVSKDEIDLEQIKYFVQNDDGIEFTKREESEFVRFMFSKKLDLPYDLINTTTSAGQLSVDMDKAGNITRIFSNTIHKVQKFQEIPVKDYDEFTESLLNATLLAVHVEGSSSLNPSSIVQSVIGDIEIVYLKDDNPDQILLQPGFRLIGESVLLNNSIVDSEYYLEAVSRN